MPVSAATVKAKKKRSLSHSVFMTVFAIAMVLIVTFTIAGAAFIQSTLADTTRDSLNREADLVASTLNGTDDPAAMLRRLKRDGMRITLVDTDGSVLYDSDASPSLLPNHAERPEIKDALATGYGSSERSSSTLEEVMMYRAVRLKNGTVVRVAESQAGFMSILLKLVGPFALIAVIGAVASLVAARKGSRAIIAPLREVDLDHPRRSVDNAYAEMVPMLDRIEKQRQELKRQMRVLADNDRMRREFTANITHELKTPLTTVSGYAELIASGMVANEEDVRDFGGRIYREAGRLTSLVNDILILSNLDEAERPHEDGAPDVSDVLGSKEPVDIPRLLDSVCARLEQVASDSDVRIHVESEPCMIVGVSRLLDELSYNLASNAIRYNRVGGSVTLSCGTTGDGHPFIKVSDTGIGIAPEEQGKIFERFYRVDKSRSKARGGTGLGLAIVKHAALYHGGTITVDSALGQGTTITVEFPPQEPLQIG